MSKVPALVDLCIDAVKDAILEENGNIHYVHKLPLELFQQLILILPPLALQNLQDAMPPYNSDDSSSSSECFESSRKRRRIDNFAVRWEALYKSRWPEVKKSPVDIQQDDSHVDWQQIYWEKHLQDCLDGIAETISITTFDGFLGEVFIPDEVLKHISDEKHISLSRSKLSYHCERFGPYARRLRLRSIHYATYIDKLLSKCRLEYLEIHWIKSKEQVEGLCKLLVQNKQTLSSLEFLHCKLPANLMSAICNSLHSKGRETNVIKSLSIKHSSFLDSSQIPLPIGLESLLSEASCYVFSSGSSDLTTLILSDNHMWWKTGKMVFDTLLEAESCLQVLDLSDNNIAGWLSHFKWGSPVCINSHGLTNKSLSYLRVLNLRCNSLEEDDADCLRCSLAYMPNLEVLNLSDNPLEDNGIRMLFPYLIKKSKSDKPLTELYLDHCLLTFLGAYELLEILIASKVPLKTLSIGQNHLTSKIGAVLGKYMCTGVQTLNVNEIRLGVSGLSEAMQKLNQELGLVRINLRGNAGGIRIVKFLCKLISKAPNLISVDVGNNQIPHKSVPDICTFLIAGEGQLEHVDLSHNDFCFIPEDLSQLAGFQVDGKPNLVLFLPDDILYDNDP